MTGIAERVPRAEVPANGFLIPRAGGGEKPPYQFEMHISDQEDPNGRKPGTTRTAGSLAPSGQDGPRGIHRRLLQYCPQRRASQPQVGAERMCGLLLNLVKALRVSDEVRRFPRNGAYWLLAYKDKNAEPAKTVPFDRGRGGRGSG